VDRAIPASRYARIRVNEGVRWSLAVKTQARSNGNLTSGNRHRSERASLMDAAPLQLMRFRRAPRQTDSRSLRAAEESQVEAA
jgi:hypothetical protein